MSLIVRLVTLHGFGPLGVRSHSYECTGKRTWLVEGGMGCANMFARIMAAPFCRITFVRIWQMRGKLGLALGRAEANLSNLFVPIYFNDPCFLGPESSTWQSHKWLLSLCQLMRYIWIKLDTMETDSGYSKAYEPNAIGITIDKGIGGTWPTWPHLKKVEDIPRNR